MEFLRDPFRQFIITTVIAVIALVSAVWIYLAQKNRKRLSYEIITSNELLTAGEELQGKVEILYNKEPVQNVHLLVVKFINDGNVPIEKDDFDEKVVVFFGKDTRILSTEVIEKSPASFIPRLQMNDKFGMLEFEPMLMNSRDSFTLKFLLAEYKGEEIKVRGRIVGVTEIAAISPNKTWNRIARVSGVVLILSFILTLIIGSLSDNNLVPGYLAILLFLSLFVYVVADTFGKPPPKRRKE